MPTVSIQPMSEKSASSPYRLLIVVLCGLLSSCQSSELSVQIHSPPGAGRPDAKILFLAGTDSHWPGSHEHKAGSELLSATLRLRQPGFETVNVYGGWPEDESLFEDVDAIVLYCDGGESHLINGHLRKFEDLVQRGVGVVALHYCVEVPKDSPGAAAMLSAIGGYFETWWSVNPHWLAHYTNLPDHPIARGVEPFSLEDEWYFNMRFIDKGVTPILSAKAPLATMERGNGPHSGNDSVRQLIEEGVPQTTAWAYERPGGGRGFGYTGGHYHANWNNSAARELVLNAIEWVAITP